MEDKIKQELIDNYGYDFDCEFWTDDLKVMMYEIIEATLKINNNNPNN